MPHPAPPRFEFQDGDTFLTPCPETITVNVPGRVLEIIADRDYHRGDPNVDAGYRSLAKTLFDARTIKTGFGYYARVTLTIEQAGDLYDLAELEAGLSQEEVSDPDHGKAARTRIAACDKIIGRLQDEGIVSTGRDAHLSHLNGETGWRYLVNNRGDRLGWVYDPTDDTSLTKSFFRDLRERGLNPSAAFEISYARLTPAQRAVIHRHKRKPN